MKKGTLLYIGMLFLLGGGVEVIRRFGTTLTPPRHIAGVWRLTPPSSADACPILEWGSAEERELRVEQSGRYLRLIFPDPHHTIFRAYFKGNVFQGSGLSTHACANGTTVYLSGRLTDSRLDFVLTRGSQASRGSTATLSLTADRTPDVTARPSTAAQSPDQGRNKE